MNGAVGDNQTRHCDNVANTDIRQPDVPRATALDGASTSAWSVIFARLLIGLVVLICAEVFSGASLQIGLWNPWTLLVTYWLYFAHFFFFTTLAVRTGRTSFWSLYLWGVLFGLYESWITKVIWYGYSHNGKFAMSSIGPYGISEMSMVLIFHPIMSFIIPLAIACLLCPSLRRWFPQLAWLTSDSKGARTAQGYLIFSFAPVMAMNCGSPVNLALNLAMAIVLLVLLSRLARPVFSSSDGASLVVFGRRGFLGLCAYLVFLYEIAYAYLTPEGLPSPTVQLATFAFYALAIVGLAMHRRRLPLDSSAVAPDPRELRLTKVRFTIVAVLALALSPFVRTPPIFVIIVANFILWPILGVLLAVMSLVIAVRERMALSRLQTT
jgi:hypothetical protein